MDNSQSPAGPSNSRSPYHSPRSSQTGGGNAPANHFGNSSVSGVSSRTSPLGCSPGMNKSVAFSKPTSTIIPGGSPVASSLVGMGSNLRHAPVGQHQSTLRVGPRLRAEGLMVPPPLMLLLCVAIAQRLRSINQQLRGRFSSFFQLCSHLQIGIPPFADLEHAI